MLLGKSLAVGVLFFFKKPANHIKPHIKTEIFANMAVGSFRMCVGGFPACLCVSLLPGLSSSMTHDTLFEQRPSDCGL